MYARPGSVQLHDRGPVLPVIIRGPRGAVMTHALIDTGSSISSVDKDLLAAVGAQLVGSSQIQTVTGTSALPRYAAVMESEDGQRLLDSINGVVGNELPQDFQALIGRDVLANQQFGYDGSMGSWYLGEHHRRCGPSLWMMAGAVTLGHLATIGIGLVAGGMAARAAGRRLARR